MEVEVAHVSRLAAKHDKKLFMKGLALTQDQRIPTEKFTGDELKSIEYYEVKIL